MLLFQDKIQTHLFSPALIQQNKNEFANKVIEISKKLQIQPDWLMAVMYHESRLDSKRVNSIGAVGLIQFMPSTLKRWNLSPAQIKNMTNIQQLHFVGEYYMKFAGQFKHALHLFLFTFYPLAIVKKYYLNDDYIFGSERDSDWAKKVAKKNKGFDLCKDGLISMREYINYHNKYFEKIGLDTYNPKELNCKTNKTKIIVVTSIIGISAIVTGYYLYKNKENVKSLLPHR